MRRRLLATNSSAAFTVSFFVVVPSSLEASSSASSFKSIIVFMYTTIQSRKHSQQYLALARAKPADLSRILCRYPLPSKTITVRGGKITLA